MSLITIDRDKCNQDALCVAICPARIIEMGENNYPALVDGSDDRCIHCGHCVAICPTGCFNHASMSSEECSKINKDFTITKDQCGQLFMGRRSIRTYKKKDVQKNDIVELLELASYAPSGHNSGGVEWLVIADQKELHKLKEAVAGWMKLVIEKMPDLAQSLHLETTLETWNSGQDVILRDAPVLLIACADKENRMAPASCTIAMSHLELAASARGLGACWAGYFNAAANAFPPMQQLLALPEGKSPFGALMLGYPKYSYKRIPKRNAPVVEWRI